MAHEVREADGVHEVERGRWSFVVAIGVAAGVILPLLGAVGFFDPWETHYGEVAREMAVRDDYLYPFWKDSYFYSKPILLFWLTAPLYKLIGADDPAGPMPALAELVGRLPSALSSLFCIAVVFFAARRLWSTRAALLSAIALATMPFWAFLSRQAITDMLYAAPAAAALLLLAVALFGEDESEGEGERERERDASTQRTPLPLWMIGGAGLCVLPQLWEIGRNGAFLEPVRLLGSEFAARVLFSVVACALATGGLWLLWRKARDPLLHFAAVLFALSTLAKGPVGVALCGLTLLVTIAVLGEWRRLARPAALSCTALFLAIAAPWPIVMTLFEGVDDQKKTWVQRFIMYDLLGRIGGGAHGDRGSFEYYARFAGFGMFPWSGLVPVALFSAASSVRGTGAPLSGRTKAERFTLLVSVWCVITFAFFAATTTKFHHYILPLCVPAALLVGRWLDRAMEKRGPIAPVVALVAVLGAALIGKDLVTEPWQFIDLFTYHYKGYKPEYYFPSDDEWRIGMSIACFGAAALMAAGALYDMVRPAPAPAAADSADDAAAHGARTSTGAARTASVSASDAATSKPWVLSLFMDKPGAPSGFVLATVAAAILFAIFAVQVHFNRASQHWSQRALVSTYHSMRAGSEPLIAFQMDWKGETFYAKNQDVQIKKSGPDLKRACEKPGREFVLVQTDRFAGLKSALGKDFESRIRVVDRSNVKWYLVAVDP